MPRQIQAVTFLVPWPPAKLNPNARTHWAVKARAAASYRKACSLLALQAKGRSSLHGPLRLSLEFLPPDARRRDDDNLLAAFKSGRDGIADALKIDDSQFRTEFFIGPKTKGGAVRVTFEHIG